MRHPEVQIFIDECCPEKGYWGDHPKYPIEDWRYEIANNDTRQGYWEWVYAQAAGVAPHDFKATGDNNQFCKFCGELESHHDNGDPDE